MSDINSKRLSQSDLDNPPKRHHDSINIDLILKKERIDNEDFNVIVLNASPQQRLDFIIRQLSFYLSSDNLSNDHFYHTKFVEDSTNLGVENVMDVKYILSAKRMMEIKATAEDIRKVISENLVPNLSYHDSEGKFYIKLNTPLPKYVGKRPFIKKKKLGETPETFHVAGPLVVVTNVPEDVTDWNDLKKAINESEKVKVRFISPISDGTCYAWLSKTSDVSEVLGEKVLVNSKKIKIELIKDHSEYEKLISAMSLSTLNSRSKDLQRIRSLAMSTPIEIGDLAIRNFGCIKTMLNTLLERLDLGTKIPLESQPGKLISFILDYHPHSKEKKGGDSRSLYGFEVGTSNNKENNKKKCYCVVTQGPNGDLLTEDLSITRCLDGLKEVIHTFKKSDRTDFIKTLEL